MPDPANPIIFVLDDEPKVAGALRDDLSRRFGQDFRLVAENVG